MTEKEKEVADKVLNMLNLSIRDNGDENRVSEVYLNLMKAVHLRTLAEAQENINKMNRI